MPLGPALLTCDCEWKSSNRGLTRVCLTSAEECGQLTLSRSFLLVYQMSLSSQGYLSH